MFRTLYCHLDGALEYALLKKRLKRYKSLQYRYIFEWVAVISAKNHKRQRRKRQSV